MNFQLFLSHRKSNVYNLWHVFRSAVIKRVVCCKMGSSYQLWSIIVYPALKSCLMLCFSHNAITVCCDSVPHFYHRWSSALKNCPWFTENLRNHNANHVLKPSLPSLPYMKWTDCWVWDCSASSGLKVAAVAINRIQRKSLAADCSLSHCDWCTVSV